MKWFAVMLAVTLSAPVRAEDASAAPDPMLAKTKDGDPFSIEENDRLSLAVVHEYRPAEVIERLSYLFAYWKKRFNISSEWHDNRVFLSGSLYGIKIQAMFTVTESSVSGFAHDPGWPWRGQVLGYVDRKLKKYLNLTYDDP